MIEGDPTVPAVEGVGAPLSTSESSIPERRESFSLVILIAIVLFAVTACISLFISKNARLLRGGEAAVSQGSAVLASVEDESPRFATIHTSLGPVIVELLHDKAQGSTAFFQEAFNSGAYRNAEVTRVIPGLVAVVRGMIASSTVSEVPFNSPDNSLTLNRGMVAFVGPTDNDGGADFFFVGRDTARSFLGSNHRAFGTVVSGMDIVDSILSVVTEDGKPSVPVLIESIIFKNSESDNLANTR